MVAERCGLTQQQIQKYESGRDRISPARLSEVATALHTIPTWFFQGFGSEPEAAPGETAQEAPTIFQKRGSPKLQREAQQLIQYYFAIKDRSVQRTLLNIARGMAQDDNG
jgi:transcriptional regulator with XRE-family HTH domain